MIGKTVLHYTITEEIGRGGMGIVYRADDTRLKRTVALKFLPPSVGPDDRARFEVEAQSVARLQHPNICGIHEINEIDGQTFIVMPFLDGTELGKITASGPMDIAEAVEVALQVGHALEEAHEHDIIHRDIKSANVIVTRKGLVKVMDFGLAKQQGSTQITQAGTSLGTVDYMSPEQAGGSPADHRTDIWSLGVMLYEMVTGDLPFKGEFDQATVYSILNQDPPPLRTKRPDAPARLQAILDKALAKDRDERYPDIGGMISDLADIQREVGAPATIGGVTSTVKSRPGTGNRQSTAVPRSGAADPAVRGSAPARILVPVGVFVAVSAVVVAGLSWSVDRYPISPHLPGFALAVFASLLPAVVGLAWFRGGHAVSRIGVPLYLVVAAAVLVFVFHNRDLGAATETVRVTDEEGNTIVRELPKGEFRKRVAVFYPDNSTGDPSLDWMSYGFAQMLRYDLNQDTYLSYGLGFTLAHKEAGYEKPVGSPLTLKREFANRYHYPRFLTGSFTRDGDAFVVDVTLYDTATGRPLSQRRYRDSDVFAIVDTMSVQLRRDVGVPDYYIAENPDLPVEEMITASLEALEHYVAGINAIYQVNDYELSRDELERAIAVDPSFALAHWNLSGVCVSLNDGESAQAAMREALTHKYRLPESEQFSLKSDYYETREDFESKFENAQRWAALHPGAAGAHEDLAEYYEQINDFKSAVAERNILFEIDPQRYWELHSIGGLYEKMGNDEEALRCYNRYAELHPDKYDSFTTIGLFHRRRGDYALARDYYRKALLIEPERMSIRIDLAEIERHTGNFEASLEQCRDALAGARTAADSSTALWQLVEYYSFRGEARKALDHQIRAFEKMRRTTSPIQVMITRLFTLSMYVDAGRFDEAVAIARSIENEAGVPFIKPLVSAGFIIAYATNEDPAYLPEVEKHTARFEEWMNSVNMQNIEWALQYCKALVDYWRGDLDSALERIDRGLGVIPPEEVDTRVWMLTSAAEIAGENEDYVEALGYLDRLFEIEPFSPEGHLEAARVYHLRGQTRQAIEHLEKALRVWENADPDHPRARRARELAEQLRLSS